MIWQAMKPWWLLSVNIMNQTNQHLLSIIKRVLLILLLIAFMGTHVVSFMAGGENLNDNDLSDTAYFPMDWIGTQIHHESVLLKLDISIFALFIVFLGGRSKNKWFNDRTIEPINFSLSYYPKTALFRAVFCFPSIGHYLNQTRNRHTNVFSPRLS